MKTFLTTLALLSGLALADSVTYEPEEFRGVKTIYSADGVSAAIRFDEPVVPESATEKDDSFDDQTAPESDIFKVTGDDAHKPTLKWAEQDLLYISFPHGTSCATEYTLRFRPEHAKYLSGKPMPQAEFTFHCPPQALRGYDVPGMPDGTTVVKHEAWRGTFTKEGLEFSPESPVTYTYKEVLESDCHGEAVRYGASVPGKARPAQVKHLCNGKFLELLAAGSPDWDSLSPESPLPGAVLVEPETPLPAGTEWELWNSAAPGVEAGKTDTVFAHEPGAVQITPDYDTTTGDMLVEVCFDGLVMEADALRALRGLRISANGVEAAVSEDGRVRTLPLGGGECRITFQHLIDPKVKSALRRDRYRGYVENRSNQTGEPDGFAAPGQVEGFVLKVEAPTPVTLDFAVPAGIPSALGGVKTDGKVVGVPLSPACPRIGNRDHVVHGPFSMSEFSSTHWYNVTVLPLKGDHKFTVHTISEEALSITAHRIPADLMATYSGKFDDIFSMEKNWADIHWLAYYVMSGARTEDPCFAREILRTREEMLNPEAEELCAKLEASPAYRVDVPPAGAACRSQAEVDMDAVLGGDVRPGVYLLRITPRASADVRRTMEEAGQPGDILDIPRYALVQITDLLMSGRGRWTMEELMVTRMSDGLPVEDVRVTCYAPQEDHEQMMEPAGESATFPLACFNLRAFAPAANDLAVLVESGDDYTLLDFSQRSREQRVDDNSRNAIIQTDRKYYRPGETVHVRAILRQLDDTGKASLPDCREVELSVDGTHGKQLFKRTVPLDASGGIDEAFTLPEGEEDVTGQYYIQVSSADEAYCAHASIKCEVFRRDSFTVETALEMPAVAPDGFTLRIQAQDFNGTPLAGGVAELEISSPVPLQTLQGEPYVDDEERERSKHARRWVTLHREIPLDAEGKAVVHGVFVPLEPRDSGDLSISGCVANDRGERVTMQGEQARLYPADFRPTFLTGDKLKLFRSERDEEGKAVELDRDQEVHVALHAFKKESVSRPNGFVYEETREVVLREEDLTIPAGCKNGILWDGIRTWEEWSQNVNRGMNLPQAYMEVSGTDPQGRRVERRIDLYSHDIPQEYVDARTDFPNSECSMGADGLLHIRAEIRHAGTAVWRLANRGKLYSGVLPVQEGVQDIALPLPEGVHGKMSVCVSIPYADAEGSFVCFDHITGNAIAPAPQYTLQTQLDVPTDTVRPGASVRLQGQVSQGGRGVPATVTLFAVDSGMLSLSDFRVVDVAEYLARRNGRTICFAVEPFTKVRCPFVRLPELRMIYGDQGGFYFMSGDGRYYNAARSYMLADVDAGWEGNGASLSFYGSALGAADRNDQPRLRTDFQPVAVWCGSLKTDAEGRFSTDVTLPDTLTTYKVFALSLGDDGCTFGNAEAEFTVDQPLMLTPGSPLFMSVGDTLRLPLTVTNNTDAEGTWIVTISSAAEPQKVTIPARGTATLYFDFTAEEEGEAVLEWTATGDGEGDAVRGSFPVRFPAPLLKEAHHIVLPEGAESKLADLLAPELADAQGSVEIQLSANPLSHMEGCVDYLLTYPYGCTEQTASALLPWLFYDRLAPLCPALAKTPASEAREAIRKAVKTLFQRQRKDGGLGYWGDSGDSSAWASAHAALVLTIAQECGHGDCIPQEKMDKLRAYLAGVCTDKVDDPLTLYAIARVLGKDLPADAGNADLVFIHALRKDPAGKQAALLQWLRARGNSPRHTTRSSAWALIALHEYLRLTPASTTEATVQLQDGSRLVVGQGVTTLTPQAKPLGQLPTVLKAVQGEVYVTFKAKARPVRTDYPGVTENGLQVTRIYEKKGADGKWREAEEFAVGDVVRVTLTCAKAAPELQYFVLEDYLPACMEAINPNIPSQSAGLESAPWSLWFDHKEYLADRVRGFCTRWHGATTLNMTYYARVMRAGTSTAPPAQAQLMYEPQIYGLSPNAKIRSK